MKKKILNKWTMWIPFIVFWFFFYMFFTEGEACKGSLNKESVAVTLFFAIFVGVGIGIGLTEDSE